MTKAFDIALDQCIDRIVHKGESVEQCLASYPELAVGLEEPLRSAYRLAHVAQFTPSVAAKQEGRQRLQQTMAALDQGQLRPSGLPARLARSRTWLLERPSWRLSGALAGIIAMVVGVPTMVAASGGTVPGDALYPVKRGFEETRLALQPSQAGKADLHLAYAGRRAEELSELVVKGEVSKIDRGQGDLEREIQFVEKIAKDIEHKPELASIQAKLAERADLALGRLQSAIQRAPQSNKSAAREAFRKSSSAFGNAVERVAAQVPPSAARGPASGNLVIVAVEPVVAAPQGVNSATLTIDRVEAHQAGGHGDGWVTIAGERQQLDLLRTTIVGSILGGADVLPGTYDRIRLHLSGATVTASGTTAPAQLPEQPLVVTRPFKVGEGAATVIQIDFDAAISLRPSPNGAYAFAPVLTVLTEASAQPEKTGNGPQTGKKDEDASKMPSKVDERPNVDKPKDDGKSKEPNTGQGTRDTPPNNLKSPEAKPGVSAPDDIQLVGLLEILSNGLWKVDGKQIIVNHNTVIKGVPVTGSQVTIEGKREGTSAVKASKIVITSRAVPTPDGPHPGRSG